MFFSYATKNILPVIVDSMQERIETLAQTFFENLGIPYSDLIVDEEIDNIYRISLKSDDSHLLI